MTTLALETGSVDLVTGVLRTDRGAIALTDAELKLLGYLYVNRHRAVTRDELLEQVWGYRPGVRSRTVEVTVARLRSKVEADPAAPRHVLTVRGVGYRLALDPDPPAAPEPPVVRPIPRLLEPLVGRARDLRTVRTRLAEARWVTIVGSPGVGKTWLARAALGEVADAGRAEALFLDGADLVTAADLREVVGEALGEPVDAWLGRAGAAMWLLDGVDRLDNGAVAELHGWVQRAGRLGVLATAWSPVGIEGEQLVRLEPLDPADGAELLRHRLEALAEPVPPSAALADLSARLEGLPLALDLAAAVLPIRDPERIRLAELVHAPHPRRDGRSLYAAVALAVDRLDPGARQALRSLGVFGGTFGTDAAEAVLGDLGSSGSDAGTAAGTAAGAAGTAGGTAAGAAVGTAAGAAVGTTAGTAAGWLAELHRRSLLRRHPAGRLSLAPGVAAVLGEPDRAVLHDLAEFLYRRHCDVQARHGPFAPLRPYRADLQRILERLDLPDEPLASLVHLLTILLVRYGPPDEPPVLRHLFERASARVQANMAVRLCDLARVRGDLPGADQWATEGLGVDPPPHHRVALLCVRAQAALHRGDVGIAVRSAEDALAVADATGDPDLRHRGLEALARVVERSDPARALELYDRQIEVAEQVGHSDAVLLGEVNAGLTNLRLGRWEAALGRVERALARGRDQDAPRLLACAHGVRGLTLAILGRDGAEAELDRAAALAAPFPGWSFPGLHEGRALLALRAGASAEPHLDALARPEPADAARLRAALAGEPAADSIAEQLARAVARAGEPAPAGGGGSPRR